MFSLEIILFVLLGVSLGVFTGLVPGIHVNSIYIFLPAVTAFLAGINVIVPSDALVSFVISMAVTHTIIDFIPSIFLGAPEDSTALSILPGHALLMRGKGLEALYLTIIGGALITLLFAILTPLLIVALPLVYGIMQNNIPIILISITLFMILRENSREGITFSALAFLLAGALGIIMFNSFLVTPRYLFFPIFTGLFGIPTLVLSLKNDSEIPPQEDVITKVDNRLVLSGISKSFFSSILVGILPGVGAAQATVLAQELSGLKGKKEKDDSEYRSDDLRRIREFLVSVGGINTVVALVSLMSLYSIDRTRSGAAVAINNIVAHFGMNELIMLVSVSLISVGLSSLIAMWLGEKILRLLDGISYRKISVAVLSSLVLLGFVFTGLYGLLVMLVASSIGLTAPLSGVKRSHLMGVLILPVTLFYIGISPM